MVADPGNSRIQVLDASYKHLMDIKLVGEGLDLQYPAHVAVNSKGEIIVSDNNTNRVLLYDMSVAYGRYLLTGPMYESCVGTYKSRDRRDLQNVNLDGPGGIAVDGDDTLYIVNGKTGTIKVVNKEGQELRTIQYGDHNQFYFGVYYITFIVIYDNQLIVCDNGQLYQVDKMGSSCTRLDYVQSARGLAVDHSGDLMIVNGEGPVTVVSDGRVVRHVGEQGHEPWQLDDPRGVAITKTGEIIVAKYTQGNLLVYAP